MTRMSPRKSLGRTYATALVIIAVISLWLVTYFATFPFSDAEDKTRHLRPPAVETPPQRAEGISESRLRVQLSSSEVAKAEAPRAQEMKIWRDFDAKNEKREEEAERVHAVGSEKKWGTGAPPSSATSAPSRRAATDPEGDAASAKRPFASSPANNETLHWSRLPLNETKDLYKSLKYSDLVIPRWFDEDFEKEKDHDSIEELGGDTLGDLSAQKSVVEAAASAGIPKKLHFTWKTAKLQELPELFKQIQIKWKLLNPDWEIKIWTDEECEKLIKDKYPELYFFYSDFEVTAERSDIFRYLVLDTEGGYYADMDIEPLQPLDGLLEVTKHPDCMVGLEPEVHAILAYNKYHMIGNAFMASVPGHPLWKWLIPQTIKRYYADRAQKDEKDATKITGPIAVDNTIQRNPEITRSCALLKPDVTAPAYDLNQNVYSRCQDILKKGEMRVVGDDENPYTRICKEIDLVGDVNKEYPRESFMVHHWAHTWRAAPDSESDKDKGRDKDKDKDKDKGEGVAKEESQPKQEPKIHASTNIGKDVFLWEL